MRNFLFNFDDGYQGWEAGFADFIAGPLDNYHLEAGVREVPAAAGGGRGLYLSGHNRSDDLFMYHVRSFDKLTAGREYAVSCRVSLATKYVSQAGIGGDPALSVYIKCCASTRKPELVGVNGVMRLNIDIGRQANAGANSIVLGTIEKSSGAFGSYQLIERTSENSLLCSADNEGRVWLLFGTDSGYEGLTSLYYTRFEVELR